MTTTSQGLTANEDPSLPGSSVDAVAAGSATRVVLGTVLVLLTLAALGVAFFELFLPLTDAVGGCGGG